jgi:hypothetical protein
MQYIQDDGTKRFTKDSKKEGCFHPVGGMAAVAAAPVLIIAEGYATAASLSEALGHGTVIRATCRTLLAHCMRNSPINPSLSRVTTTGTSKQPRAPTLAV